MAQKDYVGRGRSSVTQRKKSHPHRKNSKGSSGISKMMVVIAAAVLVMFIGALWFVSHHKKTEIPEAVPHKSVNNGLPPKPEERWKYIKELENRQITLPAPVEPSAGGEIKSQTQLTDEQRQLLSQMAEDMRQQPTQLNEVPWNQQTPEQQKQTLRQQNNADLQKQYQQQLFRQQRAAQQPTHQSHQAELSAVPQNPNTKSAVTTSAPATSETSSKRWLIQCGSFKGTDQAESTRAKLAFEGFESRITIGGGWNRVVIGPYALRERADTTLKQLQNSGYANCIAVIVGG